jgi:hypothetical protein
MIPPASPAFRFARLLCATICTSISFSGLLPAQQIAPAPTNSAPTEPVEKPHKMPPAPTSDLGKTAAKIKGAEVTETKGVFTGLSFQDCTALTEADYKQIRTFEGLKSLGFGTGFDDADLKILAGMPAVETFTTNHTNLTNEGISTLTTFKALRQLTFFHPGREFTGTGLSALATLPNLESFSLGGTDAFSDAGAAALATLSHLQEIRLWHCGITNAGVKSLVNLKELKSLSIGQQIAMKPPGKVNDGTVEAVLGISSLESLSISESRLSLAALGKLTQLPNLKRLTLKDIDISDSDLAALKQQLPKVQIDWTAPTETGKKRVDGIFGVLTAPPSTTPAPAH